MHSFCVKYLHSLLDYYLLYDLIILKQPKACRAHTLTTHAGLSVQHRHPNMEWTVRGPLPAASCTVSNKSVTSTLF